MEVYNKNRDNNKGIHDEIREQNSKFKDLSAKEKFQYFKDYYLKATIALICAIVFVGALVHDILSGPDDTVFAAYFFNDSGDSSSTQLADSFADYMGIDTAKHEVYIDATPYYYSDEEVTSDARAAVSTYDMYTILQKTMAIISSKDLDIIAGNETAINYFAKSEVLSDLTSILSPEDQKKYEDHFYYYTNPDTGVATPVGIFVNDAPKILEYHYYDYSSGIIGFVVNSENIDNALAFLDYIYME